MCALALFGSGGANAADLEIFGGYTIGRIQAENSSSKATLSGWNSSVTAYATPRFGITADFAGFYGTTQVAALAEGAVSARQHSFMAGPQFRLLRTSRIQTSVRAVIGGAYGYLPGPAYDPRDRWSLAALVGGNLDVKVSRRMSLRFSPGTYLTQLDSGKIQRDFRFSIGPVFRLGGE
jgi:hypothetical protein